MASNQQPEEPSERAITIRLSSENIVLALAVLFLLAAAVLAVFFSMEDASAPGPADATTVALASTPLNGTAESVPNASAPAGQNPTPQVVLPTFDTQPYPGPNEPGLLPTAELSAPSATTAGAVPTFSPARPTATTDAANPYPPPGGASTTLPTVGVPTRAPTNLPAPTNPPASTVPAFPTDTPDPTSPPPTRVPATIAPSQPTTEPAGGTDAPPTVATSQPTNLPQPTPIPVDVIRGEVRWTASQNPIIVRRDLQIAAGSTLLIEPGVDVRLAPGVAIYVDGKMYGAGQAGKPIRISSATGERWDAIYGRPGGDIGLDQVEISGGGNGGTLISSEGGNLTILRSRVRNNGGQIRAIDSRVDMRETDVSGNDMPYGAAVQVSYSGGGGVTLVGNRIGGNRLAAGAPPVQIRNESPFDTVNVDLQGNLLVGERGPSLVMSTEGPLLGGLSCNALMNGTDGLSIKSSALQVAPQVALTISNNAIEDQTPPIIPIYLEYGIGRGASSDIFIDMKNNWWRAVEGPYHPDLHADGRGEAVGANITFAPWLTERPTCAPRP